MNYLEFIESKKIKKKTVGIDIKIEELNDVLFDFQKELVKRALYNKIFCFFEQCGLGKTLQQLEFAHQVARHTHKKVLILAPLGVTHQTAQEEAPKLGYDINIVDRYIKDGINICNYEQLDNLIENNDFKELSGIILDESSILKNFTGHMRTKLKETFKDVEYKLCCTATPAPNDLMELLNHADFLGITTTAKALSTFFINDMKTGSYRLKGHAVKDFYKWCCTWSVNIESPGDLGFDGSRYILPELNEKNIILTIDQLDYSFENGLFREIGTSATSFHKEKQRTADIRARKCAEIVNSNKEQYLVWCDTNYEADLLKKYIGDCVEVRGNDKSAFKEKASADFKSGKIRVLISKPKIFGYGMNFQKCHNVVYCGLTYSYENYYQSLRRIYRFGQKEKVNSYIVLGDTEGHILETIEKKKRQQEELKNNMDMSIKDIQLDFFKKGSEKVILPEKEVEIPDFL